MSQQIDAISALYRQLCKVLEEHDPEVQGGALADAVATWLAGYAVGRSAIATRAMRETLLQVHMESVRELIGPNAKRLGLPQ